MADWSGRPWRRGVIVVCEYPESIIRIISAGRMVSVVDRGGDLKKWWGMSLYAFNIGAATQSIECLQDVPKGHTRTS